MVKPFAIIQSFIDRQNAIADFIANGEDQGIRGHIRQQYRNRCDQFANLPGWARALSSGSANTMNRICTPYWDQGGFDGPVAEPPFTGGQCECELYRFDYVIQGTSDQFGTPYTRSGSRKIRGPVGSPSYDAGAAGWSISGRSSDRALGASDPPCGDPQTNFFTFIGFPSSDSAITTFTVTSLASTPGDCGDPPPDVTPGPNPPPDPGPTPGPEPRDDPSGGPIPEIPIPPYEDPVFGPVPIDPGDDDGDDGDRTPSGGDGLPGADDAVGGQAGTATGGEDGEDIDFGPPPEGRVWVGALVEITVDPRLGNIPGTGPENTVYPTVLGNASLRYQGGRGRSSRLLSKWSDLVRPVTSLVVLGAYVHCLPGVVATVYPISAIICPDDPCGDNDDG